MLCSPDTHHHLQKLTLNNIAISNANFLELSAYVRRRAHTLIDLDVSSLRVGQKTFHKLVQGLSRNKKLRSLNLSNNIIQPPHLSKNDPFKLIPSEIASLKYLYIQTIRNTGL